MIATIYIERPLPWLQRLIADDTQEIAVEVAGTFWAGTPDVMYMPNGDPGYPGDPPEVEIEKVTGEIIVPLRWLPFIGVRREIELDDLTDEELELADEAICEQCEADSYDCEPVYDDEDWHHDDCE